MKDRTVSTKMIDLGYNLSEHKTIFENRIWHTCDVAQYLDVSIGHIYNLTSQKRIPHRKKGGRIYFFPEEIREWVNEGNLK